MIFDFLNDELGGLRRDLGPYSIQGGLRTSKRVLQFNNVKQNAKVFYKNPFTQERQGIPVRRIHVLQVHSTPSSNYFNILLNILRSL